MYMAIFSAIISLFSVFLPSTALSCHSAARTGATIRYLVLADSAVQGWASGSAVFQMYLF
jgi:hypothetical protein